MTPERLSGLDASFLYMETPTLHMHVAITAVFDPSTVPGGYSFRRVRQLIIDRIPLAPVFQRRLVEVPLRLGHPGLGGRPRVRHRQPPPPGRAPLARAACASWPTSRPTSSAASCTATAPCGRCGWSRASRTGRSPWWPRCTTAPSTACPARSCCGVLFDFEPDPPATPTATPRQLDPRIPSGARAGLPGDGRRPGRALRHGPQASCARRATFQRAPHPPEPDGATPALPSDGAAHLHQRRRPRPAHGRLRRHQPRATSRS